MLQHASAARPRTHDGFPTVLDRPLALQPRCSRCVTQCDTPSDSLHGKDSCSTVHDPPPVHRPQPPGHTCCGRPLLAVLGVALRAQCMGSPHLAQ